MKRLLWMLVAAMMSASVSAQTILIGDTNGDGELSIADVTSTVNMVLGKSPAKTIDLSGMAYRVDNTMVAGTWYAPSGMHFTLNADGTTDYPGGATFKFMPSQGHLIVYDAMGLPTKAISLWEVTPAYLLAVEYATGAFTRYTNSSMMVSGITLSQTSLSLNSGTTAQLTATVTPAEALNPSLQWASSDESVATVSQTGLVTAVGGGTATVTCTATDGSGVQATCQVTVTQLVTGITLSHTILVLELDGYQKLTATVLPANATNTKVTWTSSDEDVAEVTSSGGVAAVGIGSCTITCEARDGSGVQATCQVTVSDPDSYEYVDLGLPSGTLWATCNVGAENPEDYGDYFAWGETTTKSTYNWSTYKYCNGSNTTLTKYCTSSSYGTVDNKTELDLEDDAAYMNWGGDWRMPSYDQLNELINSSYTTTEGTTQNGVNGYKITSKSNGKSIFLPAAGFRYEASLYDAGSYGNYWSRTLYTSNPSYGRFLFFDSSDVDTYDSGRCNGFSVRPVRVSQ